MPKYEASRSQSLEERDVILELVQGLVNKREQFNLFGSIFKKGVLAQPLEFVHPLIHEIFDLLAL